MHSIARFRRWIRNGRRLLRYERELVLFCFLAATAAAGWTVLRRFDMIGDEAAHLDQINAVTAYLFKNTPFVAHHPALPGYHALLALAVLFRDEILPSTFRGISLGLGLASAWTFFRVARNQESRAAPIKTLQYFFQPLVFVFAFLLYTDVPSLLTIFLMAWAAQRKRPFLLAAAGLLSILFRQNNVVWLAAFASMEYIDAAGPMLSVRRAARYALKHWMTIAVLVLFALFVWWNGGVAIADRDSHPLSFHWGNIHAVILASFIFFLPLHLANLPAIARLLRRRSERLMLWIVIGALVYMQTFATTHYYNTDMWWLRNWILAEVLKTDLRKILFFLPVAFTVLSHAVTPLCRRGYVLLYPATVLFLGISWLIEPRYYVIPLSLFLLFRRSGNSWLERILWIWGMAGSGVLFWGLYYRAFLP